MPARNSWYNRRSRAEQVHRIEGFCIVTTMAGGTGRRTTLSILMAVVVVAIALMLSPMLVGARGGGGGHSGGGGGGGHSSGGGFGGGSFGGGGSSYSGGWGTGSGGGYYGGSSCSTYGNTCTSGGGGSILGAFALLAFGGPILLFIVVMLRARRAHASSYQPAYQPAPGGFAAPVATVSPEAGIAAIQQVDPAFNQEMFLERAQMAFFKLQQAWEDRNVDEARGFMADGLYTAWHAQIAQMISLRKKNILENLNIQGMHIVKALHDSSTDAISVKIDAVCADYEINEDTNKLIFGSKSDKPFTEYWTFTRAAGTKTVANGGISAQKCPNCGAPVSLNAVGECTYCHAAVSSGNFDWVLATIQQVNEWQG